MIKAIIFDLGGVLTTPSSFISMANVLSFRVGIGREKAINILEEEWTFCKLGKIPCEQMYKTLGYEFGMKQEEFKEFFFNYFKINEGVINLIPGLKDYKLYIFTNNSKEKMDLDIKKLGLKNWDGIFCSCDYKMAKPEKKFYELVQEKIGFSSEEILFIDDKLYNLKPAKDLGWNCIHFKSVKQLKEDLEILNK